MNQREYLFHLDQAIARRDVEALVGFWSQSRTERGGEAVRERIIESIPYLARDHQIPYEGDSFRDFVLLYDKVLLDRGCASDPNACLLYFAEKGHFKGVLRALENGAQNVTEAIEVAIKNLRLELIGKILWEKYLIKYERRGSVTSRDVSELLALAAKTGDVPMTQFFLDKIDLSTLAKEDITIWYKHPAMIVKYAAKKGNLAAVKLVHEFMERNLGRKYDPHDGLTLAYIVALKKGYKDIREYTERSAVMLAAHVVEMAARVRDEALIESFFNMLNQYEQEEGVDRDYLNKLRSRIARWGMRGAARGGHQDLVKRFIELGASDEDRMEEGMVLAAKGGHLELVKFFEERGASDYFSAMNAAAEKCQVEVLDYLRPHINPEKFLKEIKRQATHGKLSRRECMKAYLETL